MHERCMMVEVVLGIAADRDLLGRSLCTDHEPGAGTTNQDWKRQDTIRSTARLCDEPGHTRMSTVGTQAWQL